MTATKPDSPVPSEAALLKRIRITLGFFICGLIVSGLTAFPLLHEINWLCGALGYPEGTPASGHTGLAYWLLYVREGLHDTYTRWPFLAYGTDWLAFAHIVIAFFFVAPLRDPVRNQAVFRAGITACFAVVPLALIVGQVRGIPIYWRLIDCSFGMGGVIPLWLVLRWTRQLESYPSHI